MLHDFKTVVLSSRNRVLGTEADCFVEIKEGLLDSSKKYVCELVWMAFSTPTFWPAMKTIMMVIDGLWYPDTYCNTSVTPFACINTSDWKTVVDSSIMYEPQNHKRKVFVRNNQLRVKLYNAENFLHEMSVIDPYMGVDDVSLGDDWVMELRFTEIPQELEY